MKQILLLLLLFLPCLAMAQYTGNANQKITLGEQTTADGLVYRGVASADTTRKPSIDTMAFILLDTTTNILWQYKKATNNAWTRLGGSISSGVTGVLPVANGGTGSATKNFVDLTTAQTVAGAKTFSSELAGTSATFSSSVTAGGNLIYDTNDRGITSNTSDGSDNKFVFICGGGERGSNRGGGLNLFGNESGGTGRVDIIAGNLAGGVINLQTGGVNNLTVLQNGNVGIGTTSPQSGYRLHVVDSVYVGGNVSASAYTTRSDYDLKDEIQNISYGINEVMQMQPVKYTYKSNGSTQLGFIAQDLGVITPEVVSFEDKMSVYYNALIPILTKAIQEQQAIIKALEQRILTLENK